MGIAGFVFPDIRESQATMWLLLSCLGCRPDDGGSHTDAERDDTAPAAGTAIVDDTGGRRTITLYSTRHAEKEEEGEDPGLTEEGLARAQALAELMHDVPLPAFFTALDIEDAPAVDGYGQLCLITIDEEGAEVDESHYGQ